MKRVTMMRRVVEEDRRLCGRCVGCENIRIQDV